MGETEVCLGGPRRSNIEVKADRDGGININKFFINKQINCLKRFVSNWGQVGTDRS